MMRLSMDEFEELVADAIDSLPLEFLEQIDNVGFFVEEEPPADAPGVFGLYEGIPLTERSQYLDGALPDAITIFKGPHERLCNSRAESREEIRRTVVHEIAHYFGMDEDQIDDMGYA